MCRDVVTLLTEVEDISTVKALHTFLRERENAPWRLRTQAAHALAAKGLAGAQALAGYVGESLMDVQRVMLDTENALSTDLPRALLKLLQDLRTEDAIDLEAQTVALRQKMQLDGLLDNQTPS